ncbi:MAG: hypothetical protein JW822_13700 [Spirochaetales bacterium]|nr:hypothetical protein [Spirochaetales bacterium]
MNLVLLFISGITTVFLYFSSQPEFLMIVPLSGFCIIVIIKDYLKKRDIFSPLFLFTFFYLFWMGGGYVINYLFSTFFASEHKKLIPVFLFIGYAFFYLAYSLPVIIKKKQITLQPNLKKYPVINSHLLIIYCIALFSSVVYYFLRGSSLFSGAIQQTRFEAVSGFGYIYHLMMMFTFFIYAYLGNKWFFKKQTNVFDWLLILIALVLPSAHLHRGPIIWSIIYILVLRHYLIKKISFSQMLLYVILIFYLAAFIQNLRWQGLPLTERIVGEIKVHIYNLSFHLTKTEQIGVPLGIKPIWMSIAMLKPGPDLDFASWLKDQYGFEAVPSVTLIGEGFLSYKVLGIILEFIFIGFLLKQFYYLYKTTPSLRNLCLYIIIVCQSCSAVMYGLHKVLISTAFGVVLTFLVIPKQTLVPCLKGQSHENINGK